MKNLPPILLYLAIFVGSAHAQEVFSAYCASALTGYPYPAWRVAESKKGLVFEHFTTKKKKSSVVLVGDDADKLRVRIASLRFTQANAETLRSLADTSSASKKEDGKILLRPFDGVTYHFVFYSMTGVQKVWIDNPAFDLEHHRHVVQCDHLEEVLSILDFIERRAKGGKEATQT